MPKRLMVGIGILCLILAFAFCQRTRPKVSFYDVIWTSPSNYESGSMPLGNGEIGINFWADSSGVLWLYVARTDAWDGYHTLLKIAKIRIEIDPNPFSSDALFEQRLDLHRGEIALFSRSQHQNVRFHISVDANEPVIDIDYESDTPLNLTVSPVIWREGRRMLEESEKHRVYGWINSGRPIWEEADSLIHSAGPEVMVYHRNTHSIWRETLVRQGMQEWADRHTDPLLHRTFGFRIDGSELVKSDSLTLKSKQPNQTGSVRVFAHTRHPATVHQWRQTLEQEVARIDALDRESRRRDHRLWWANFWDRSHIHVTNTPLGRNISRGYALQRFISACAGRGNFAQKFNGSLFTTASTLEELPYNADFRRWGGGYWLQNTRLIYWPLLKSGDTDLLQPFFTLYSSALPYARAACKRLYGHAGAFFPETIYFWGSYNLDNFGWNTDLDPFNAVQNSYIRYYFQGSLEVASMMLSYVDYSGDANFGRQVALPFAWEVVKFYRLHYPLDSAGKLHLEPAQALETYWDTVNPTPPIAGLHRVVQQMLDFPGLAHFPGREDSLRAVQAVLPKLPLGEIDGKPVILPAEVVRSGRNNHENPELYAAFPYPLYGVGRSDFTRLKNTYELAAIKVAAGWQNGDVYAACAGAAATAARLLAMR
ncbi:hypothetical protein JW992_01110, partial [candidate division KSB1 bacterium]|nr:hypothetical protein [candidate division KSB1 bacterium]